MPPNPESQEHPKPIQRVDLLARRENHLDQEIEIPAEQLGALLWQGMVDKTQEDGKERGLVTTSILGKPSASSIFTGTRERDSTHESVKIPLKQVFASFFLPAAKKIAFVHTHPMPSELDHLATTIFSDKDIHSFNSFAYRTLIMIDRGGVHALFRTPYPTYKDLPPNSNLSDLALDVAKKGSGLISEARKELANQLYHYGIRYYYTPSIAPVDGRLRLKDARV